MRCETKVGDHPGMTVQYAIKIEDHEKISVEMIKISALINFEFFKAVKKSNTAYLVYFDERNLDTMYNVYERIILDVFGLYTLYDNDCTLRIYFYMVAEYHIPHMSSVNFNKDPYNFFYYVRSALNRFKNGEIIPNVEDKKKWILE
jgi:hypothetical protein